jgi:inhibitor of the pro-sigma K processing machinery
LDNHTLLIITLAVAGILMFGILFKIIKTPIKWALKLLINSLIGFVALFIINFIGDPIGLELGINWLNAIVIGILGMPGVVLLILIKYLF